MGTSSQQLTHTIGASTTLGLIPAIDGLSINGEISASELNLQTMGYKIGAEFEAPNGVNSVSSMTASKAQPSKPA